MNVVSCRTLSLSLILGACVSYADFSKPKPNQAQILENHLNDITHKICQASQDPKCRFKVEVQPPYNTPLIPVNSETLLHLSNTRWNIPADLSLKLSGVPLEQSQGAQFTIVWSLNTNAYSVLNKLAANPPKEVTQWCSDYADESFVRLICTEFKRVGQFDSFEAFKAETARGKTGAFLSGDSVKIKAPNPLELFDGVVLAIREISLNATSFKIESRVDLKDPAFFLKTANQIPEELPTPPPFGRFQPKTVLEILLTNFYRFHEDLLVKSGSKK